MLTREVQEKEALAREKAALEVRLQAVERDRQELTEQLLGLRSGPPPVLPGAESFAKQGVAKLNSLPKVYGGFNEL